MMNLLNLSLLLSFFNYTFNTFIAFLYFFLLSSIYLLTSFILVKNIFLLFKFQHSWAFFFLLSEWFIFWFFFKERYIIFWIQYTVIPLWIFMALTIFPYALNASVFSVESSTVLSVMIIKNNMSNGILFWVLMHIFIASINNHTVDNVI